MLAQIVGRESAAEVSYMSCSIVMASHYLGEEE